MWTYRTEIEKDRKLKLIDDLLSVYKFELSKNDIRAIVEELLIEHEKNSDTAEDKLYMLSECLEMDMLEYAESLPEYFLSNRSDIITIDIPSNIKVIGPNFAASSEGIDRISINPEVIDYGFCYNASVKHIEIGDKLTTIESYFLDSSENVEDIIIESMKDVKIDEDGFLDTAASEWHKIEIYLPYSIKDGFKNIKLKNSIKAIINDWSLPKPKNVTIKELVKGS